MALLLEAPWFRLDHQAFPTNTGRTIPIDYLDARLEELAFRDKIKFKSIYEWVGKLPDGSFISPEHGIIDENAANTLVANGAVRLPDDWWEYACGTLNGHIVKAPKFPRQDMNEPTQTEIDSRGFEGRLDFALSA